MREYKKTVSTDTFQRILIEEQYEDFAVNNVEMFDLIVEEQQVEQWVYTMSLSNLKKEAEELGYELELAQEQEMFLEYELLLDNLREIEADENLSDFIASAQRDLEQFQENYPEIVSEYSFKNKAIVQ